MAAWVPALALYTLGMWMCSHGLTGPSWRGVAWAAWILVAGMFAGFVAAFWTMVVAFRDEAPAREPLDPAVYAQDDRDLFDDWRRK